MTRRNATLGAIATAGSLALAALGSGTVEATGRLARVVEVSPSTTFHVSRATATYHGTMIHERVRAGLGGGKVPEGMATAARHACYRLYATGRAKGLNPHVLLLWYPIAQQGPNAVPAVANFGSGTTHFDRSGNWSTEGIVSVSIANGDKFTATGGFFDPSSQSVQTSEETKASYKGRSVRVECDAFHATRTWPF
ncbi:MAG: hypothetical protein ACXVHQ_38330 [Solirubrobacteraceae bacterium]